ncbi:MAG: glycoside hydrolase family 76 [Lasallia pustulata]|uniref:Mannan endo-1,6-alpha-mannosidase n=1 Tax=Lasallia pustulata TaxID=136370 RepID=A0A5M8PGZ1_9LECA|nr:MAG: glycoside hydrolase family 76 [Lasallia pustulata]
MLPSRIWYPALVAAGLQLTAAMQLIIADPVSIKNAARTVAYGMMTYYTGNASTSQVGLLPPPYYWWEAGAMWGALVDYWYYTNDSTYNNVTTQALLSQVGPKNDYMVPAQQFDEGNDDQSFWGFAVMSALERNYPAPPSTSPQWLPLVEALWNTQVPRWDMTTCAGGLKWQIFSSNAGYNYKNSIANGGFFQLAARLARYTGNQTYVDWAEKIWDWTARVGLIDNKYNVYDGTDDTINCTAVDHDQETYNVGIFLYGAAVLYNYTNGSTIWESRTTGLLNAAAYFFSPFPNATHIMYETICEKDSSCNNDAQSFKAYLARWMWATTQVAPYTRGAIMALLRPSAQGAAASCSGGKYDVTCGSRWYTNAFDNVYGVGEQLAALEVIQGLLINDTAPPLTGPNVDIAAAASVSSVPVPSTSPAGTIPAKKGQGSRSMGGIALGRIVCIGIAFVALFS